MGNFRTIKFEKYGILESIKVLSMQFWKENFDSKEIVTGTVLTTENGAIFWTRSRNHMKEHMSPHVRLVKKFSHPHWEKNPITSRMVNN